MSKTTRGNFFEDFVLGQEILHATPRTVTEGDATLYLALTGSRFAVHCAATLARMAGLPRPPLDDLLTFHLAFGRSVPDVSLNAIANLGYADGRFGALLYPGDTLTASSRVIGLKRELERQSRHRLCAHARDQGGWPRDPRVRALGDGRQARSGKSGAGAGAAASCRTTSPPRD